MFLKKLFSMSVAFLIGIAAPMGIHAQTLTVRGTVSDAGGPVSGAVVMSGGAHAVTDLDGNYSIHVPAQAVLEVSCLGYTSQQVPVNGRSRVDIVLSEDSTLLDDAVVVGYGTQKKANLTGAVSVVKSDDLKDRPALDVGHML